jgi:fumarylpyruvate hydrolase
MTDIFSVATPSAEIAGSDRRFPVRRIFCVGKNYADHAREMGGDPEREPPFFFSKPADAVVPGTAEIAMPPRTANLHHEIELVVAIGKGGANIALDDAAAAVFGYAVGNDLTRRDLQADAKAGGRPWDMAKGFDRSAILSPIRPAADIGHPSAARIWLTVNGAVRQDGDIADMIWPVADIIAELSTYVELQPGDLIYTGTPAGVGRIAPGDLVEGGIDGIGAIANRFV